MKYSTITFFHSIEEKSSHKTVICGFIMLKETVLL